MRKQTVVGVVLVGILAGFIGGMRASVLHGQGVGLSVEDRLSALEAKTQDITRGVNSFGRPWVQIAACVGINTNALCNQALGQGAMFTVKTSQDRFAGYFEVNGISTTNLPTTAVYASVVAPNPNGQLNIGVESHAKNAPAGTVALWGDSQYAISPTLGQPVTTLAVTESDGGNTILRSRFVAP